MKINTNKKTIGIIVLILFFITTNVPLIAYGFVIGSEVPYKGSMLTATNTKSIGNDKEFYESMQSLGINNEENEISTFALKSTEKTNICGTSAIQGEPKIKTLPKIEKSRSVEPIYSIGDTKIITSDFYDDEENEERESFTAELVAIGETCTIWVDQEKKDLLSINDVNEYVDKLDNQITPALLENFGDFKKVDVDKDNKVAFVFYKIKEEKEVQGFFNSIDLFTKEMLEEVGLGDLYNGNIMDMLHINIDYVYGKDSTLSTIAHELQHLINYAQTNGNYESWLSEVFSESARVIGGYGYDEASPSANYAISYQNYYGNTHPFVFDSYYVPDTYYTYGQWFLFGRYLAKQTKDLPGGGDSIYKTILDLNKVIDDKGEHSVLTKESLVKTLKKIGYIKEISENSFEELIFNFNMALLLREGSGVYSLTNDPENPSRIDNIDLLPISLIPIDESPKSIVGGGATSYMIISNKTIVPKNPGEDITFKSIEITDKVYPSISPGEVLYGTSIRLSTENDRLEIYYTTDGSDPYENGILYDGDIKLDNSMVVKTRLKNKDMHMYYYLQEFKYTVKTADVISSIENGTVKEGTLVELKTDTEGANIYYTIDSENMDDKILYKEPIKITKDTVIRAYSTLEGNKDVNNSEVSTFNYKLGVLNDGNNDEDKKPENDNDKEESNKPLEDKPQEKNNNIVNTGDKDNTTLWFVLIASSFVGMITLVYKRK